MLARGARLVAPAFVATATATLFGSVHAESDEDLFVVKSALNPKEFRPFRVEKVSEETHNTRRLRFSLPDEHHELGLSVASCLVVRATIDGEQVVRPYTPVSRTHEKGHFDLVVKGYAEGKVSKALTSAKVGDEFEMKGPFQKMKIKRNMKKAIGMIAGGSGVTPMIQVIQELLDDPRDKTELRLLFANVTEEDIILKDYFDALALIHPRFKVYYTVDKPSSQDWEGFTGYVTKDMIQKTMPPPSDDNLVMICGPPPMVKAVSGPRGPKGAQGQVEGVLKDTGYTQDQVFKF